MTPRTLERRIGLWFTAALVTLYGVVAAAIWATSRTDARQVAVLTLKTEAEAVATYVAATGRLDAPEILELEREPFPIWMRILDGYEVVAATPGAPRLGPSPPVSTEEVLYLRPEGGRRPYLVIRHAIGGRAARRGVATAVEAIGDIETLRILERRLVTALVVLGFVLIPPAAWGGRLLARRALAPIARLVDGIRGLSPEHLDRRLELPPRTVGEVEVLATSFNELLERLELSVKTMRRFTADASHEIRNPLSVMRTGIEVALRRARPIEEYQALLHENLQEIERLRSILDGLLALGRDEPGRAAPRLDSAVDLAALVRESAARFATAAAERAVELEIAAGEDLVVLGDPDLLRLVPFNLLHNALKHGPPGEPVRIAVGREGDRVVLRVADRGPGIPEQQRLRIFERYVRLREGAADSSVGGVGLAVVRWVAETHGGAVRLLDGSETCFEVSLPAAETNAA